MAKNDFIPEDAPQSREEWCVEVIRYAQSRLNSWKREIIDLGYLDLSSFEQGEMFADIEELSNFDDPETVFRKAANRLQLVADQLREDYPAMREQYTLALRSDSFAGFEEHIRNDIEFANWTQRPRYS